MHRPIASATPLHRDCRALLPANLRPTPHERATQCAVPAARRAARPAFTTCRGIRDVASEKNFA
ncbi:uncharacterized protein BCN122_II1346 [Burkholderia cenocepacia]|nr:uncharacterized protein BCN122_II1346 [Burkholderia cenocepacia]